MYGGRDHLPRCLQCKVASRDLEDGEIVEIAESENDSSDEEMFDPYEHPEVYGRPHTHGEHRVDRHRHQLASLFSQAV